MSKPRLRKRSGGEVEVPAYAAMQDDERLGARMLDILMKGVSTRNYAGVIGAMAGTVGVSKSAVSQETIEAAEKSIDEVLTRRLDELDLLVIYVDGLIFSDHVVLAAVGVDRQGNKHVLGLQHAATESTAAAEDLLTGIVERGVSTEKNRLFVLDGSKALRAAVRRVFGKVPVQRCRAHKLRNVVDGCRRPSAIRPKRRSGPPGGWELKTDKRGWRSSPSGTRVTGPMREGMEECFTINRLGVPPSLHRCLATTNIVESRPGADGRRDRSILESRRGGLSSLLRTYDWDDRLALDHRARLQRRPQGPGVLLALSRWPHADDVARPGADRRDRFSKADAEAYPRYCEHVDRLARIIRRACRPGRCAIGWEWRA